MVIHRPQWALFVLLALLAYGSVPPLEFPRSSDPAAVAQSGDAPLVRVLADGSLADDLQAESAELQAWFPTAEAFRGYRQRAELAAKGRVAAREDGRFRIQIDQVLQGDVRGDSLEVFVSGGLVRPRVGDAVILLANQREGKWSLHSFCPISGLFHRTAELEQRLLDDQPNIR